MILKRQFYSQQKASCQLLQKALKVFQDSATEAQIPPTGSASQSPSLPAVIFVVSPVPPSHHPALLSASTLQNGRSGGERSVASLPARRP